MHQHNKFGIPTSKNIGDMHLTELGTEGLTDGWTDGGIDSVITIMPPKCPLGHKKQFC